MISGVLTRSCSNSTSGAEWPNVASTFVASFSRADQQRIRALQSRIIVGQTVSPAVLANFETPPAKIVDGLHEAFLLSKAVRISYFSEKQELTRRIIEPHFLLLNYPVWYALAFDHLRGATRTFRCDRIRSLEIVDETFRPRPFSDFHAALEGVEILQDAGGYPF